MSSTTSTGEEGRDERRRCVGTSKKTGEPCTAYPMEGSDKCSGHAGRGFGGNPRQAAEQAAAARTEQAEVREEARKRAHAQYQDAVEEDAEEWIRIRRQIARDTTAPAGDRLKAMRELEDRGMGKPKETVVTEEAEPAIVSELRALTPEQRRALLRDWNEPTQEAGTGS